MYIYFLGVMKVNEHFDYRTDKQEYWVSKRKLGSMFYDGKMLRGSVPLNMRIVAKAVQDLVFAEEDIMITVPGTMVVKSKEECMPKLIQMEVLMQHVKEEESTKRKGKEIQEAGGDKDGWVTVKSHKKSPQKQLRIGSPIKRGSKDQPKVGGETGEDNYSANSPEI